MTSEKFKKWNLILGWSTFTIALITYSLTLEPTESSCTFFTGVPQLEIMDSEVFLVWTISIEGKNQLKSVRLDSKNI